MLAGGTAAIADDQISRLLDKGAEAHDAVAGLQIEVDAGMQTSLAEVAVECAGVVVAVDERAQVAQIVRELLRWRGGIFPARPCLRRARDACGGAKARFAHLPDQRRLARVFNQTHCGWMLTALEGIHRAARHAPRLILRIRAKLDEQPATAR